MMQRSDAIKYWSQYICYSLPASTRLTLSPWYGWLFILAPIQFYIHNPIPFGCWCTIAGPYPYWCNLGIFRFLHVCKCTKFVGEYALGALLRTDLINGFIGVHRHNYYTICVNGGRLIKSQEPTGAANQSDTDSDGLRSPCTQMTTDGLRGP